MADEITLKFELVIILNLSTFVEVSNSTKKQMLFNCNTQIYCLDCKKFVYLCVTLRKNLLISVSSYHFSRNVDVVAQFVEVQIPRNSKCYQLLLQFFLQPWF